MKKSNKILALGLGLSLIFAPATSLVSNNINLVYAEENQEEQVKQEKEVNPEEFVAYANDFVDSDEFKALDEKDQKEYKELIKDLTAENLGQDEFNEINEKIDDIKFSYISNEYDKLKEELLSLKTENLSVELTEKIDSFEDSYQTYDQYFEAVNSIENTKEAIKIYNEDLKSHKDDLKKAIKAIENNKDFKIDLNAEKAVLENKNAKLDEVDRDIDRLNNKVEEEKNRLSNISNLKIIVDGEKSTKESSNYKKASKTIREDFDKKIQAAKDAYEKLNNKEKVENVNQIISNYNSAFDKLDGDKNLEAYNELVTYYNENKDKLSEDDQKKYEDLIGKLDKSEDFGVDKINELKAQIEKAIKDDEDSATLKKVGAKKIGVQKSSGPKVKRSRSFVRTGVKSVGIVVAVLVVAGLAYFFVAKKDKK